MGRPKGSANKPKDQVFLGFDPWDDADHRRYGCTGPSLAHMYTRPWHPLLDTAMHTLTWMMTPDPPDPLAKKVHQLLSLIHTPRDPPPPRMDEVARFLDWKGHYIVRGNPLMVVFQLWMHGTGPVHAWLLAQPRSWGAIVTPREVVELPTNPEKTIYKAAEHLIQHPMYQIWALNRDLTTRGMVDFPHNGDFFSRIERIAAIERLDSKPTNTQIRRLMQDVDVTKAPVAVGDVPVAIKALLHKETPRVRPPGYAISRGPFPQHTLPGDDVMVEEPMPSAKREREWAMRVLGLGDEVFEVIRDTEKSRYYRNQTRIAASSKPHTRRLLSDVKI